MQFEKTEKEDEKDSIEAVLSDHGQYVDMRIYSQESIMASVKDLVSILKLPLKIQS